VGPGLPVKRALAARRVAVKQPDLLLDREPDQFRRGRDLTREVNQHLG
jgi:hypothetical protein